jgi:hypothetical protein
MADRQELWRLPLRRGNGLRGPEEPQIRSKSQIDALWRKVATSANDRFEKRQPDDFRFAADMLLLSAANIDAEETINVSGPIVLLLPLTLAGCISFSSSSPSPPAKNTTIVVPPDSTITH